VFSKSLIEQNSRELLMSTVCGSEFQTDGAKKLESTPREVCSSSEMADEWLCR